MKLDTRECHVSGHWRKSFQGQRLKVKVTARRNTLCGINSRLEGVASMFIYCMSLHKMCELLIAFTRHCNVGPHIGKFIPEALIRYS